MVKQAITAALAILCLLLVKATIDTFRASPALQQDVNEVVKKDEVKKTKVREPLELNPAIKATLPDLGTGYLFNAERFLAKGSSRLDKAGKGSGDNIRMDDVVFSGAILGEGYKKAIVSYQIKAKTAAQIKRAGPRAKAPDSKETIQLEVGDQLGGYKVKEITSDFILFAKGSDTIKKTLFDPGKDRQKMAPRKNTPPTPIKRTPSITPSRRPTPPAVKNQ